MAEDTSILHEIDEALRADKLQQFWARNSAMIVMLCALVVLSTAASTLWRNHVREVHERQTGLLAQAIRLAGDAKYAEAIPLYEAVEKDGGGLGALAALRQAQALVGLRQEDKALALYNDIAAGRQSDAPQVFKDYAALQADILAHNKALRDTKPPVPTEGVKEAQEAGHPFSRTFLKLEAERNFRNGDSKSAARALNRIIADKAASYPERENAARMLEYVGEPQK